MSTASAHHAEVVADMFRRERDLTLMLDRVRKRLDAELVAVRADRSPIKELAFEVQQRLGLPTTASELERLSRVLRQRTTVAHRRAAAARGPGNSNVAVCDGRPHHDGMTHDPYLRKRRIIEETFGPPGTAPDVEDLNGDDDDEFDGDDEDPADHDLGDSADQPGNKNR